MSAAIGPGGIPSALFLQFLQEECPGLVGAFDRWVDRRSAAVGPSPAAAARPRHNAGNASALPRHSMAHRDAAGQRRTSERSNSRSRSVSETRSRSRSPMPVSSPARCSPTPSVNSPPPASPASSCAISASMSRPSSRASSNEMDCGSNVSDETITGDEFITVASKKGKRKANSPSPTTNSAKIVCGPSTAPSQPYVAPRPKSACTSQTVPRNQRPPPIVIRDKKAWEAISKLAYERKLHFTKAVNTTEGIQVSTQDAEAYRLMTHFLTMQGVAYHRFPFGEEKGLRVVVRGVPKELATDAIKNDLIGQSLPVREVHRMYRARERAPIDLVVVILDLSPEGKKVFNLKSICHISGISVEPPHRRGIPGQCHRCQLYGHSAR